MVWPPHFDHEKLDRIQAAKERLVRVVAMLTKLLMRFDALQLQGVVR